MAQHISPLQCNEWGLVKREQGWGPHIVHVGDSRVLVLTKARVGMVVHGPSLEQGKLRDAETMLDQLVTAVRRLGCWFILVHPYVLFEDTSSADGLRGALTRAGFTPSRTSISYGHTALVDLGPNPEDILAGFSKRTRGSLRKAMKEAVCNVRMGAWDEDLQEFYDLYSSTYARSGTRPLSRTVFDSVRRVLVPRNLAKLYFAEADGEAVSAAIILASMNTWLYMYGASNPTPRTRGSGFGQVLHWQIIQDAKKSGACFYDLGGVTPPGLQTNPKQHGIYLFKSGFGRLCETVGTWKRPLVPLPSSLLDAALAARTQLMR